MYGVDDARLPGEDEAVLAGLPDPVHDLPDGEQELPGVLDELPEVVDGLPVLAEVRALEPAPAPMLPALQTAAAAATGFIAGAATLALLHRRSSRRVPAAGTRQFRPLGPPPGGTHRTYLVHVISRPLD